MRDIPAGAVGSDIVPYHQCDGSGWASGEIHCQYCGGDGKIVLRIDYINPEPKIKLVDGQMSANEILNDLARAKAIFQLRAITAAMGINPDAKPPEET